MISIHLNSEDLENIRFAYSPLTELSMSYAVLQSPDKHGPFLRWVEEANRALFGVDLPYMQAAIPPAHYIADFLTPTPTKARLTFEDQIATLRETPTEILRSNIESAINADGDTEIRRFFIAYPREALECLIEELRLYWDSVLAHHWPRIDSVLEGDVLYHARELALNGVDTMIGSLSPKVTYRQGVILLDKDCHTRQGKPVHDKVAHLDGRGLQLVPGIFAACGISWQIVPEWRPMLIYEARGIGLWNNQNQPDAEEKLVLAFGAGRARLLQALRDPSHTGELAQRLDVTSGAISQQLGRLNQAGLVELQRSSNRVYYRLTERGERLMELFLD